MIELREGALLFSFPEVSPEARLLIEFQRTLRVPDDGESHRFPLGLGRFALCHVDDHAKSAPPSWIERGGVVMPMYQSEALWLRFLPQAVHRVWRSYPFAIQVSLGARHAATGQAWSAGLHECPQDYMVAPEQYWLDGYRAEDGTARQLTAFALACDPMAEEHLHSDAEPGGLRIVVRPMKLGAFHRRFPDYEFRPSPRDEFEVAARGLDRETRRLDSSPGDPMCEEIHPDPYDFEDWDLEHSSCCFVHVANSVVWEAVTGEAPPLPPPTKRQYAEAGLPWLEAYDESLIAADRRERVEEMRGAVQSAKEESNVPPPANTRVKPRRFLWIRAKPTDDVVREQGP